jgi:hypothetical protein
MMEGEVGVWGHKPRNEGKERRWTLPCGSTQDPHWISVETDFEYETSFMVPVVLSLTEYMCSLAPVGRHTKSTLTCWQYQF